MSNVNACCNTERLARDSALLISLQLSLISSVEANQMGGEPTWTNTVALFLPDGDGTKRPTAGIKTELLFLLNQIMSC